MSKLIISKSQMKALKEGVINIGLQSKSNDLNSFTAAATNTNAQKDISKAGIGGQDVNAIIKGPDSNDDQPKQVIDVAAGDTVQNAIAQQGNNELLQQGGSMEITGDGFGECKCYTKKAIKEAKLKHMYENGIVMTKKQMQESFLQ